MSPPRPGSRRRPTGFVCALALIALVAAIAQAGDHPDASGAGETPSSLYERYGVLSKRDDFGSFSERMDVIRRIGDHPVAAARRLLLHILTRSRSLDDRVVATLTLGPILDGESIRELATRLKRPQQEALAVALAQAFGLATDPGARAWLATDGLRSRYAAVREAAIHAAWVHGDAAACAALQEVQDTYGARAGGVDVQFGVVRALGSIGGPEVRARLLAAYKHEDWRVRLAAADVMAHQKPLNPTLRGALKRLLGDPEPGVRRAAAQAVGRARQDEMVPELAALLEDPFLRTRAVAHDALIELSGKDLGFTPAEWIAWWDHRDADATTRPAPSTSVATYYGLNVYSDRMLFIIDLSGSMAFPWGDENTRISVARKELTKVLRKLSEDSLFNVIVFSDRVKAWRKGEAQATTDNVEDALAWIEKTFEKPRGGTYMHAALEKAFRENPQIDTIYLLTDGLATDGEPVVPEAILASLAAWNRYRRVVIHTIALTLEELDPNGVPARDLREIKVFMQRVAAMTGGDSRIVSKPPEKR